MNDMQRKKIKEILMLDDSVDIEIIIKPKIIFLKKLINNYDLNFLASIEKKLKKYDNKTIKSEILLDNSNDIDLIFDLEKMNILSLQAPIQCKCGEFIFENNPLKKCICGREYIYSYGLIIHL